MTLVESIIRDLYQLPNPRLVEVARLVNEMVPQIVDRQWQALANSYGCMDDEGSDAFERAVLPIVQ